MPKLKRRSNRPRDLFLYLLIGVGVAVLAILLGIHAAKTGEAPDAASKWAVFSLNSIFVFGSSIRVVRPMPRSPKFWAGFVGLFALHGAVGWFVLSRFERIPLIWYVPLDAAEIAVLSRVLLVVAEQSKEKVQNSASSLLTK